MGLNNSAEHLVISVSNKTTLGGAIAAFFGWIGEKTESVLSMTGPEILNLCTLIGAAMAVAGFATSVYFQRKRDRREAVLHELRIKQLQGLNRASNLDEG